MRKMVSNGKGPEKAIDSKVKVDFNCNSCSNSTSTRKI